MVVRVTPGPAGACVLGDADSFTFLNTARLLDTTIGIFAGIYAIKMKGGTLTGKLECNLICLQLSLHILHRIICLACVVACPDSIFDHTFGVLRTGVLFTDDACSGITGALFVTVIFVHNFTRLRKQEKK